MRRKLQRYKEGNRRWPSVYLRPGPGCLTSAVCTELGSPSACGQVGSTNQGCPAGDSGAQASSNLLTAWPSA